MCSQGVLSYHCRKFAHPAKMLVLRVFHFRPGDGVLPLRTMAPLTKDSTEIANSSHGAVAPSANAAPKTAASGAGHLRADALSLEVPVKVHGSRLTDAASGSAPRTEPFEEETGTMIVFPQGGVLRMSTTVNVGQMLVVANLKTRQDAICRVIKVRTFTNMQGYVEVEFTHQQPGYWGVTFPSESAAAPLSQTQAAPVIQTVVPSVAPPKAAAPIEFSPLSANPAAPLPPAAPVTPPIYVAPPQAAFVPPSKPEPSFISIGTQEKTQPAASLTAERPTKFVTPIRPSAPERTQQESVLDTFTAEIPKASAGSETHSSPAIHFPSAPPVAPPSSLTMSELRGDEKGSAAVAEPSSSHGTAVEEQKHATTDLPEAHARSSFGSLSGGATLGGSHATSTEISSGKQEASAAAATEREPGARQNHWVLIAACVGLLFVGVIGGVLYLRPQFAGAANNSGANSNGPSAPQTLAFQTPGAIPEQTSPNGAAAHGSATNPVVVTPSSAAPAVTVRANSPAANISGAVPSAAAKQPSKVTSQMMNEALEQHPVAAQRGDAGQADAAPSLDASAAGASGNSGALAGIVPANSAPLASPEVQPEGPVKIGGNVKEPRVVARVMPEYPLLAKQSGIQGNVVVETTIDAKGNVVNMKAISGPNLLRGAALTALKRWKYEPSTLNGQPIAVQMLVTLKFSL
jgi:TonB family protein